MYEIRTRRSWWSLWVVGCGGLVDAWTACRSLVRSFVRSRRLSTGRWASNVKVLSSTTLIAASPSFDAQGSSTGRGSVVAESWRESLAASIRGDWQRRILIRQLPLSSVTQPRVRYLLAHVACLVSFFSRHYVPVT